MNITQIPSTLIVTRDGELDAEFYKAKQRSIRRTRARQALKAYFSHMQATLADFTHEAILEAKLDFHDHCTGSTLRKDLFNRRDQEKVTRLKMHAGL